jgi:hypothetical protein
MSRKLLFRQIQVALFVVAAALAVFGQAAQASDALSFWKNYFVTGDYVVAGVGLRGTGVNGFATGTINLSGVPCTGGIPVAYESCNKPGAVPADVVAAFLYWETEETSQKPSASNGFFDGNKIVGKPLGDPNNPACWSSGGTTGAAIAAGRTYRADVLRYLPFDPAGNNVRIANGSHTVKLPDSGGKGNGNIQLTGGATLVVVYRVLVPGKPQFAALRSVVAYDGAYTLSKRSAPMTQTIGGYYQASDTALAQMTPIVANAQPDYLETLTVNGAALNGTPFIGRAGGKWDNPTFPIGLAKDSASYTTQVTANNNQVCLTFASIWTSTNVTDTDNDGLLDKWETRGLHLNPGSSTLPATFGGCADYPADACVDLPAMGANALTPDIFVEIDWLHGADGHLHLPKYAALNAVAQTFANHRDARFPNGIAVHFDVGNNYQGMPFIIPATNGQGGEVIEESPLLLCPNAVTTKCTYSENYSVLGYKKGFHGVKEGFPILNIPSHFARNRKDIFHYVLFAHALAGPFDPMTGKPISKDPKSVSGVADRPGGDLMVTLGLWRYDDPANCDPAVNCVDQTGSDLVQAGTLMHELGHNLGLSHAGLNRSPNCVPNYPSVMNYLYQTRGLTDFFGKEHVDYSSGSLSKLNELSLSETQPLGPLQYRVRFWGPSATIPGAALAHCDGTTITDGALYARLETPGLSTPDWNNDGKVNGPWALDANFNGSIGDENDFADSNDWANLNLQQVGARLNVNGLSADIGSLDLGSLDLGSLDLGSLDLGSLDLGSLDLGSLDLGSLDLGSLDLGSLDLGDVDYDNAIKSLDATTADNPLVATGKIDRITLTWGGPALGKIRHYNIYRSDPAHPTPVIINHVDGVPPVPAFDDVVNDKTDAGAACPADKTCYNTSYTYYVTSVDINGTESTPSNNAGTEITHLFVVANALHDTVYGDALSSLFTVYGDPTSSLPFTVYGDGAGSVPGANCAFTIFPVLPRNKGIYPVACTGPDSVSSTTGVTYNVAYSDGDGVHNQGSLTITQRPITVTASASSKVYDGYTNSTSIPAVTSGSLAYSDKAMFTETYDNPNVGTTHLMTPAGKVDDGNGGNNYLVTFATIGTGIITKATAVISVTGYVVTYDGAPHTATGTATGVLGEILSGLDLSGTTHTNVGTYFHDPWTFTDTTGNYNNAGGSIRDTINPR